MAKKDLTKRQREAESRRRAIMSSRAFQEWWSARQHIHPVPSDPFRAYIIDLSLYAKVHSKLIWRGRVPRADYPPIDLPSGIPAPKRRIPSRKEERRFKRVPRAAEPPPPPTSFEKELLQQLEMMSEKVHVPKPEIHLEREAYPL